MSTMADSQPEAVVHAPEKTATVCAANNKEAP